MRENKQKMTESDAPKKLKSISDAERAKAISVAISDVAGWNISVEMTASSYHGALGRRGPFKHPASLSFEIRALDIDDKPRESIAALSRVSDEDLAESIARRMSIVAGEDYIAEISFRRVSPGSATRPSGKFSLLVALREIESKD